jgi:hypothetical protein
MALGKTLRWLKSAVIETALTGDPSATIGEAKRLFVKEMVSRDVSSLEEGDTSEAVKAKLKKQAETEAAKKRIIESSGVEVTDDE